MSKACVLPKTCDTTRDTQAFSVQASSLPNSPSHPLTQETLPSPCPLGIAFPTTSNHCKRLSPIPLPLNPNRLLEQAIQLAPVAIKPPQKYKRGATASHPHLRCSPGADVCVVSMHVQVCALCMWKSGNI